MGIEDAGTDVDGVAEDVDAVAVTDLPDLVPTGDEDVDRALDAVAALTGAPLGEHVAAYEQAHAVLRACLAGASRDA